MCRCTASRGHGRDRPASAHRYRHRPRNRYGYRYGPHPAEPRLPDLLDTVQPAVAAHCGDCHVGERFGFPAYSARGELHPEESAANYETFLALVSIDAPQQSRLLAKVLPEDAPESLQHAGGPEIDIDDPLYTLLLDWIDVEKGRAVPRLWPAGPNPVAGVCRSPQYWAQTARPPGATVGFEMDKRASSCRPSIPIPFNPLGTPSIFWMDSCVPKTAAVILVTSQ